MSGHATAALLSSVMNSRRLMYCPRSRITPYHIVVGRNATLCITAKLAADGRDGSFSSDRPAPDALGMSASLRSRPNLRTAANRRGVPLAAVSKMQQNLPQEGCAQANSMTASAFKQDVEQFRGTTVTRSLLGQVPDAVPGGGWRLFSQFCDAFDI